MLERVEVRRIDLAAPSQVAAALVTHQIDEAVYLADRILVFGRRPGRIKEIVPVNLPRPRPLSLKRSPEFAAIADCIWRLIEEDVRASVIEERG